MMPDPTESQATRDAIIRTQLLDTAQVACRWISEDAIALAAELNDQVAEVPGDQRPGLVHLSEEAVDALDRLRVDMDLLATAIG